MGVNGTKSDLRVKSVSFVQISYSIHLAIEGVMNLKNKEMKQILSRTSMFGPLRCFEG